MEVVWCVAIAISAVLNWLVLRRRSASVRWKWHPILALIPTATTIAVVLTWSQSLVLSVFFATLCVCIWVQSVQGVQFCGECGRSVRNPMYQFQNWERCPRCQEPVQQTPAIAKTLFFGQFASLSAFMLLGALALAANSIVVLIVVALLTLGPFAWASLRFHREVQLPARNPALRSDSPRMHGNADARNG